MKQVIITKFTIIAFLVCLFASCSSKPDCVSPIQGKAVLVAYRIGKHSEMWLRNPATGTVFNIKDIGGRRAPTIDLNDTINVQYCHNDIIFNKSKYVVVTNESNTFVWLKGYDTLYVK